MMDIGISAKVDKCTTTPAPVQSNCRGADDESRLTKGVKLITEGNYFPRFARALVALLRGAGTIIRNIVLTGDTSWRRRKVTARAWRGSSARCSRRSPPALGAQQRRVAQALAGRAPRPDGGAREGEGEPSEHQERSPQARPQAEGRPAEEECRGRARGLERGPEGAGHDGLPPRRAEMAIDDCMVMARDRRRGAARRNPAPPPSPGTPSSGCRDSRPQSKRGLGGGLVAALMNARGLLRPRRRAGRIPIHSLRQLIHSPAGLAGLWHAGCTLLY